MTPDGIAETSRNRLRFDSIADEAGPTWTAFVGGDSILLDRPAEAPFATAIRTSMQAADLSLVNLEGPIAGDGTTAMKSGPVNQTVPETPTTFAAAGLDAVTLANNHIMDFGPAGLRETIDACENAGLGTCGAGDTSTAALQPYRTTVEKDIDVAVVSLCEREFGVATDETPGTAWVNDPQAMARVDEAATAAGVTIVAVHGGIEYVPTPTPVVRDRYRELVDAGADIIVGHHPHVPQGWERIDGVPVFYSLGNFLFDQQRRPNTSLGLALEVEFRGSTAVSAELVPTRLKDGRVHGVTDQSVRDGFLDHLHRLATITQEDFEPHWQEVADRVFLQRHGQMIRKAGGGDLLAMIRQPALHVKSGGLWDTDHRRYPMLALLNLVRNESHRAVIETALSLRTGTIEDKRTPAVVSQVRDCFERTEDRQIYDPPSVLERGLRLSVKRFRQRVRDVVPTPSS